MWLCSSCGLAQLLTDPTVPEEPRGTEPAALVAQAADAVERVAASGWMPGRGVVTEYGSPHGGSWLPMLAARGLTPAGAPFFRYNVIDMMAELEVDVGVPVAAVVDGDGDLVAGVLPAGRYATLTHVGHPSELLAVTKTLLDWATGQNLSWDMTPGAEGERWASRLEIYLTDPCQEPDMSKWVTQLAFRLADQEEPPSA